MSTTMCTVVLQVAASSHGNEQVIELRRAPSALDASDQKIADENDQSVQERSLASSHENEQMVELRMAPKEAEILSTLQTSHELPEKALAPSPINVVNDQSAQMMSISTLEISHQQPEKIMAPSPRNVVTDYYSPRQIVQEIYLASKEGERFAVPLTLAIQISPLLREFVDSLMTETAARGRFDFSDKRRLTIDVPCSADALRTMVDFVVAKMELEMKLSEEGRRMTDQEKKEHWRDYIFWRVAGRMDIDDIADNILRIADYLSIKSLYDLMKCCFRLRL